MNRDNWKTMAYLTGGAIGLVTGLLAAHMYAQSAEANNAVDNAPAKLETSDVFTLGLALVALIRQVSELGARRPEERG